MKRLLSMLLASVMVAPVVSAETFTDGGSTYTYTVKQTQQLNSGVKHSRLRFSSPRTLNVQIVEVDLTDPNVRVEAALGTGVPFKAQTLVNLYNAKKNEGRKPLVVQNANFWAMSSQGSIIDDGKYAANSCLGGFMVNDDIIFETNCNSDTWVGGPSVHGVLGIADGKAVINNYATNVRLMCHKRWGTDEVYNVLQPTLVNKFCHYGTLAIFTKDYPSTRDIKVIDSRNGQPGTAMSNGEGIYVYCSLKSGQKQGYNEWCDYEIKKIDANATSGTRGSYDLVIVGTTDAKNIMGVLQVGDVMRLKYFWHHYANATPVEGLHNVVAGNSVTMQNGAITASYAQQSGYNDTQYSRSGYGVSADGKKLVMCVIDKSTDATYGTSNGCTSKVMSYIMKHFGASDVLNCDAGGSAQMVIGGKQAGTPSDNRGIVGSVVVYDIGSTETGGDIITPEPEPGTVTEYTPTNGNANPFAYMLNSVAKDGTFTYGYSLNAPAKSATLELMLGDEVKKSVQLTGLSAGAHNGSVSLQGLPAGEYRWSVTVDGEQHTNVRQFGAVQLYHPQAVEVVNNMEDPFFGTIITAEGRATTNTKYYSANNGGQGVYLFYPNMEGIKNVVTGKCVFRGGLSVDNYKYTVSGSKTGMVPRKIRIADDGRIFMTTQSSTVAPLYELPSVEDMVYHDAAFTQVTGGPIETGTWTWTTTGGEFLSAPNVGLAVKGSGKDLVVTLLGGTSTLIASGSHAGTTCHNYAIGESKLWGDRSPEAVSALDGKYLSNYTNANINYDNRGGLWFSQYRGAPQDNDPTLVYIDANGVEKYKNTSIVCGGGGFRFSPDYSQVVMSSSTSTFSIYDITWSADGVPTLTERVRISHSMGTNVNDYAWDHAHNLYAVGNSGEWLKGFSVPRSDNSFTTTASSRWNFTIEEGTTPVDPDPVEPTLVEVTPANGQPNPFAYDLKATVDDSEELPVLTVEYTLNADAKSASIMLIRTGDLPVSSAPRKANTVSEGTAEKIIMLGADDLTNGTHIVVIPLTGMHEGNYSWTVQVEGAARTAVETFGALRLNHPQGVSVVRDYNSPYYGYVLATEGRPTTASNHFSGTNGGQGIYIFKPLLDGAVKNKVTGQYAFKGGLSDDKTVGPGKNGASPRKLRIADDGRIFVSTQSNANNPIYEVPDLEALVETNADFSPVIDGTYDASTYMWRDANGEIISGSNVAMDVKGGGDDLKILHLYGGDKLWGSISYSDTQVDEIALGSFTKVSTPQPTIAALQGKYSISMSSINLAYDNRGGFWWVQHRGTPSASLPAIKYIDGQGNVKYSDETSPLPAGGVAFDPQYQFLAMPSASGKYSLYNVNFAADGTPSLVERYRVTHGMGSGINDFSWDNAGNLYAVSSNGEWLKGFSFPRDNNTTTTEASTAHRFTMLYSTTGVDQIACDGKDAGERSWNAYGGVGTITITGDADKIEIFNLKGKCVSRNKRVARVNKGIYIVRADGASVKVLVK